MLAFAVAAVFTLVVSVALLAWTDTCPPDRTCDLGLVTGLSLGTALAPVGGRS
jgi:hypothetical protein